MQKPESAREIISSLSERFQPEKAEAGYETVIHLKISGDRGGEFTVTVEDGKIKVEEGLLGDAKCVVSAKDSVYEDVEWERTNPQMAFLLGKVKVSDIGEMLDFAGLFHKCPEFYKS
ncbi:MAG: SCP2 sterol-binding domain-containing protein [Chitinophagales bacterium]|nr:SCP2 sterol-binding domain-containing protein [Chitinophagales bacterium]